MKPPLWKIVVQFLIQLNIHLITQQYYSHHIYPPKMKTHPQKNLYINVHSKFIHKDPKMEITQKSFKRINKLLGIQLAEYYSAIQSTTTETHSSMDKS